VLAEFGSQMSYDVIGELCGLQAITRLTMAPRLHRLHKVQPTTAELHKQHNLNVGSQAEVDPSIGRPRVELERALRNAVSATKPENQPFHRVLNKLQRFKSQLRQAD
jgi:hypothetical protein